MEPSEKIWVVIAAYNEAPVIAQVLQGLAPYGYHIVVVDDGSSDQTSIAASEYPVTVLRHAVNLGQGAALQTGMAYALQFPQAEYIVTFDADGQHHPDDIARMIAVLQSSNAQVALGSRFLSGGKAENIHSSKRWILSLATWFTRRSTGLKLTDTHNGLRVFTRTAAEQIQITQNGMAHASEILSIIAKKQMTYCEVPVTIVYTDYSRMKGQSILNGVNILWELLMEKFK